MQILLMVNKLTGVKLKADMNSYKHLVVILVSIVPKQPLFKKFKISKVHANAAVGKLGYVHHIF